MIARRIARYRVFIGFLCAALVLWLARPTGQTLLLGAAVAALGEAIRVWAAGHVEKSREVTRSGPYQFTRHPLYLGSSIIGIGVAIASGSVVVAVVITAYLAITITAAIRAEEAHLRHKFGGEYDAYAAGVVREPASPSAGAAPQRRAFSVARALGNREHHAMAGLVAALTLLALKAELSIR